MSTRKRSRSTETEDSLSEGEDENQNKYDSNLRSPSLLPLFQTPNSTNQPQIQAAGKKKLTEQQKQKQAELQAIYKVVGRADKVPLKDFQQAVDKSESFFGPAAVDLNDSFVRAFLTVSLVEGLDKVEAAAAAGTADAAADADMALTSMRFSSIWHMINVLMEVMRHVHADEGFVPFFVYNKMSLWVSKECRRCAWEVLPVQ